MQYTNRWLIWQIYNLEGSCGMLNWKAKKEKLVFSYTSGIQASTDHNFSMNVVKRSTNFCEIPSYYAINMKCMHHYKWSDMYV